MSRKPVLEGGKREELTAAAAELFLRQGYDGTSVRAITRRAGCEVGLFYYYFKDKSEMFDRVAEGLLRPLRDELRLAADRAERNPCRGLGMVCAAFAKGGAELTGKIGDQAHWTVRKALEMRMLEELEETLRRCVGRLSRLGAKLAVEPETAVQMLSHGLGRMLLIQPGADPMPGLCLIQGADADTGNLRTPVLAEEKDLAGWMELAERTERFTAPGRRAETERAIREHIRKGEAYVVRWRGQIVGAVCLSVEDCRISHLSVHPGFLRRDLTQRLLETALACFPVGQRVALTVEDADLAAACARYGFEEESPARSRVHWMAYQTGSVWPGGYRL